MRLHLVFAAMLSMVAAQTQPLALSCASPDSIAERYLDDADRLALARTFRTSSPWVDSIAINSEWSNNALNALLAVFNSDSPERDTVVDLLDIHIYPKQSLRSFFVDQEQPNPWIQSVLNGNPTGITTLDDMIAAYGIHVLMYPLSGLSHVWVRYGASFNINAVAVSGSFEAIPNVLHSEPEVINGDGNNITDSVFVDHVNLVYRYSWGDCSLECMLHRYWEFNIYPDCSVEFVGSHGNTLSWLNVQADEAVGRAWSIHPNPVDDILNVQHPAGHAKPHSWEVRDTMGRTILQSEGMNGTLALDVASLAQGGYMLMLHSPEDRVAMRFIKR